MRRPLPDRRHGECLPGSQPARILDPVGDGNGAPVVWAAVGAGCDRGERVTPLDDVSLGPVRGVRVGLLLLLLEPPELAQGDSERRAERHAVRAEEGEPLANVLDNTGEAVAILVAGGAGGDGAERGAGEFIVPDELADR